MKEKMISAIKRIFSIILGALMIFVFFAAICYIVAFIVGLPASEQICAFLEKYILPYVYMFGILDCLIGTLYLYLTGKHVFVLDLSVSQIDPAEEEQK